MLIAIGKVVAAVVAAGLFSYFAGYFIWKVTEAEVRRTNRMAMVIPFSAGSEDLEYLVRNARKLSGGSCEAILLDCGADEATGKLADKLSDSMDGLLVIKEEDFSGYIKRKL